MKNTLSSKCYSLSRNVLSAAVTLSFVFFSSCAPTSTHNLPRETYSSGQISGWKSYLSASPLSNNVSANSSLVRSKANDYLPDRHNAHIEAVAEQIDMTVAAERAFSAEATRINRDYEINKALSPIAPIVYDSLRDKKSEGFWEYLFQEVISSNTAGMAAGFSKARYESQMKEASSRILGPVLERGKSLVLAEYELTRGMQVQPTEVLAGNVQKISDEHFRQLLPGVWKEHFVWHKVWLFSSNGNFQWEFPVPSTSDSGRWFVNNGILTLQTRFGSKQYLLSQEGKAVLLKSLDGKDKSKLTFVSSDSSAYRQLLRSISGGNVRFNANF